MTFLVLPLGLMYIFIVEPCVHYREAARRAEIQEAISIIVGGGNGDFEPMMLLAWPLREANDMVPLKSPSTIQRSCGGTCVI